MKFSSWSDEVPFGFVQFKGIEKDGIVDWGFFVDPNAPRGTEMTRILALCHAFSTLRVHISVWTSPSVK